MNATPVLNLSRGILLANVPPDTSQHQPSLIVLFLVFQVIGLVGGIIIILTARFYSPIKRHATWYNFMLSWVISSISYNLLLFSGQIDLSGDDKGVPFGLCVFQSSVIYAAPPLSAAAMLGMVAQIWFSVHLTLFKKPPKAQELLTKILLVLPYVLFLAVSGEALAFGLARPDSVRVTGSGMYCNSGLAVPGRISAAIVSIVLFPAVVIEIFLIIALRKHWDVFRSPGSNSNRINMLHTIIRVFLFSIFGIFALGLSVFFFFTIHHGAALNIVIAIIPVVAVFVFGSQKDLVEAWMFWKWDWVKKRRTSHSRVVSESNSILGSPVSMYDEKDLPPLPA